MHFAFTDEQEELRPRSARLLADHALLVRKVRERDGHPDGFDRSLWHELTEMGIVGMAVPEEYRRPRLRLSRTGRRARGSRPRRCCPLPLLGTSRAGGGRDARRPRMPSEPPSFSPASPTAASSAAVASAARTTHRLHVDGGWELDGTTGRCSTAIAADAGDRGPARTPDGHPSVHGRPPNARV